MGRFVSLVTAGLMASLVPAAGGPSAAPPGAGGEHVLVSPAGGSAPAVVDRYAAALHHFRKSLDAGTAGRIAAAIIASSNEQELDARLVVAAVVTEGMLDQARARQGEARIAGRAAGEVIAGLAADLGRRIERATRLAQRAQPTMADIGHALEERAARQLYPRDPNGAAAKAYPRRVIRLYHQFCGDDAADAGRPER